MIKLVTSTARRADAWLHSRFDPAYRVLLTVGLVTDIGRHIVEAPRHVASHHHLIGIALSVALELALLVHQVGEMDGRLGFRAKTTVE